MSSTIEESGVSKKTTYAIPNNDSSLNLKYMEEKAKDSIYISKYLNDDMDNKINDMINFNAIKTIIQTIKELCQKNIENDDTLYDVAYNIGRLYEILPNYYLDELNIMKELVISKNLEQVNVKLDDIIALIS